MTEAERTAWVARALAAEATVARLRGLLAALVETEPAALDQNQRPYCLCCDTPARWGDDGWSIPHPGDCPWRLARTALGEERN